MNGFIVAVLLAAQATPPPPCRPGDSLVSLGKAAFFKAIERGAFAIGERTLDDLLDGLGAPSSPSGRKHATPPAQARAAAFPSSADAALGAALKAYVDSPSSDASDAAFQAFLEKATKILFETPPDKPGEFGHVGLALEESHFGNRGSTFSVQDMTDESRRASLEASLFGDGPDMGTGKANRILGASPFFKAPVIADTRNVDRNNLGIVIKKEQDLRALWFEDYHSHLSALSPAPPPAQITDALNAGWPVLQKLWAFKRTEIFIERAQSIFGTEMRQINERFNRGGLPVVGCDTKAPAK
jgi:hypothetical protein